MRKSLRFLSLSMGALLLTILVRAQADHFAYSITDIQKDGANWSFLKQINMQTGEYSPVLLSGNDASFLAYDATSKKQFTAPLTNNYYGNMVNAPFGTGVAAAAYDRKTNRLYYTPMFFDQLRYVDLNTMKVYYVTDQPFTGMPQKSSDQGNIVTRMVIGADGYGYAITNDATHLLRFTTGKKVQVTDLGSLVDDLSNKEVSVHNSCTSFGGDMIADDNYNLYILSARNYVFKVNVDSKVATNLGMISGLPANFTVNGAAVNEKNQVLVSSAMDAVSYFTLDPKTWSATPFPVVGTVWHSSDLANSNLLVVDKPKTTGVDIAQTFPLSSSDNSIQIFPNPITNNKFSLQFNTIATGSYLVQITDVTGKQVLQQKVNVNGKSQVQAINLDPAVTRGIYLIKVTDQTNEPIFSSKIVLQ